MRVELDVGRFEWTERLAPGKRWDHLCDLVRRAVPEDRRDEFDAFLAAD